MFKNTNLLVAYVKSYFLFNRMCKENQFDVDYSLDLNFISSLIQHLILESNDLKF